MKRVENSITSIVAVYKTVVVVVEGRRQNVRQRQVITAMIENSFCEDKGIVQEHHKSVWADDNRANVNQGHINHHPFKRVHVRNWHCSWRSILMVEVVHPLVEPFHFMRHAVNVVKICIFDNANRAELRHSDKQIWQGTEIDPVDEHTRHCRGENCRHKEFVQYPKRQKAEQRSSSNWHLFFLFNKRWMLYAERCLVEEIKKIRLRLRRGSSGLKGLNRFHCLSSHFSTYLRFVSSLTTKI